jgi:threonine dehydrogenase-like Zn-dependent dehydrogenase
MRATVFYDKGDIRVEHVPDPCLRDPSDALVRITYACICGSDLLAYRGQNHWIPGWRLGHEWIGIVEEVGSDVTTVKPGQYVLAPFTFSDGSCEFCASGLPTSCVRGATWGREGDGGQGEAIRVPFADSTLITIPHTIEQDENVLKGILLLTDVMGTGYHGAIYARIRPGGTVVIIGDGPVGLCSVLAARLLRAERIIVLGHHKKRLALAVELGATETFINSKQTAEHILEMTGGGISSIIECVGTKASMDTATHIIRPGGYIGYVGAPHGSERIARKELFRKNITLCGGLAPVRNYIPLLLPDILTRKLDPSPILDTIVSLDQIPMGYQAMHGRKSIKVMVRP